MPQYTRIIKSRWLLLLFLFVSLAFAQTPLTEIARSGDQSSSARIEATELAGTPAIAVVFTGTDDLHYYATPKGAPAPGLELKVTAQANGITFAEPVFPAYQYFADPAQGEIEVFVENFKVLFPIRDHTADILQTEVIVNISGITCTSKQCLPPFTKTLAAAVDLSQWPAVSIQAGEAVTEKDTEIIPAQPQPPAEEAPKAQTLAASLAGWKTVDSTEAETSASVAGYFLLALLAGVSINIMPCVLPVIPLIIMRLISQAKQSSPKRMTLGFSFCGGIVLFFAVFALLSVIVKLSTGVALDLNSLYRNPTTVITLFLFIVFFALVLLDLLTLTLPSSIANKQGTAGGFAGSIGMGFFAGILSTPCSGAILGAVLVWAQTQPLYVSSTALILMGVGMALPYAILVSIPSLLNYVPKPGMWMENFKKAGGFLLLLIAVKFTLTALPKDRLVNVLMFGVIFSFAVWMWGTWVGFNTPKGKKWTTRLMALFIAVSCGIWLLPGNEPSKIDWQSYDAALIEKSIAENRPVVLKFTADWCTNCKIVDKNVFQQPDIAKLIEQKDILAVKADTTLVSYPAAKDLNAVFGEAGSVPLTVLLNPNDKSIIKLRGIFTPMEFKQMINQRF
ncbi:MAG: thioredoxin family protein [Phycisphaerae bacterium]|nr:thioredoxin family protein [Phycisphaerae bacterium]